MTEKTITLVVSPFQKDCLEEALSEYIEDSSSDDPWYWPTKELLDALNNK